MDNKLLEKGENAMCRLKKACIMLLVLSVLTLLPGCSDKTLPGCGTQQAAATAPSDYNTQAKNAMPEIPPYAGKPYVLINNDQPFFTEEELTAGHLEEYSPLDALGRPHAATALVTKETIPTEKRGKIGMIKPAGWHTVKYPGVIPDLYLYNRCHIIGYQLTGQNANKQNLMTGTRSLNVDGMLPFENKVAWHVRDKGDPVLYRVTPIYANDTDLLAKGVLMEAMSHTGVLKFCAFAYNEQPGIQIDHATGASEVQH